MNYDPQGFYWAHTEYCNEEQKQVNARYIYNVLSFPDWNLGLSGSLACPAWTLNAICGFLGNVDLESTINPGIYNDLQILQSNAYGLVQWVPGSRYRNWAQSNGWPIYTIKPQLARLWYEENIPSGQDGHEWYVQTNPDILQGREPYNLRTELAFWTDTEHTVEWLSDAWLFNYERPSVPTDTINTRQQRARKWYNFLSGTPPTPPGPGGSRLWWYWKMRNKFKQKGVDFI